MNIEYKQNMDYTGQDVFVNGQKVGELLYGNLTQAPQDRTLVTMLSAEKGTTRYHKDMQSAKEWIKNSLENAKFMKTI